MGLTQFKLERRHRMESNEVELCQHEIVYNDSMSTIHLC